MRLESSTEVDEREIREGTVVCSENHRHSIRHGIIDLLSEKNELIEKERNGLKSFALKMRNEGFADADLLTLFERGSGPYWDAARLNLNQAVQASSPRAGDSLLEIGANNCWASGWFSAKGIDVTALDISDIELQGLRSADVFMNNQGTHFERVMSSMTSLPFVDGRFRYVFCSASLHHNKPEQLQSTLTEIYRVLQPEGMLIVINEPTRGIIDRRLSFGKEVEEYEGNENIYSMREYRGMMKRAGFSRIRMLAPDSFYAMVTSGRYANYARKNLFLKIGFASFVWLWKRGLQNTLKFVSFPLVGHLFGGMPFNAVATKNV